jgi:heme A synthase
MKLSRFAKYAWGVLVYSLAVILWGAFVRASGSGAGCGSHWPLCNGVVIPRSPRLETLIEFIHRLNSGLALLLVVGLLVWAFRAYPRRHLVRRGASLAMFFMITEALVGAGLVLFQLVADNTSLARALWMAVHLANTFLLLASLALTAWWAWVEEPLQFKEMRALSGLLGLGMLGVLVLGVSGAVTALGDTLFPAGSLAEGLQQDFSPTAHFLIRLRLLHPLIAVSVAAYLMVMAALCNSGHYRPVTKWLARALSVLLLLQLGAGVLNVALLAPVWMQLAHLFLSDLVWITLVLLTVSTLARQATRVETLSLSPHELRL